MTLNFKTTDPVLELLRRWGRSDEILASYDIEIDSIEEELAAITDAHAAPLTGMPRGSDISDKTARAAERYSKQLARTSDKLSKLRKDRADAIEAFNLIDGLIKRLTIREQSILSMRYKRGMGFQEIAARIPYSIDGVESIERRARKKMRKAIVLDEKM